MPKNSTLAHQLCGSALITLVTLVGSNVLGQFDFSASTDIAWNEQDALEGATGGTSLTNLNARIDTALADATDTTLCYVLSGTPTNALTFNSTAASCSASGKSGKRSLSANWLALKSNQHVDYELGAEQLLTITGYESSGVAMSVFNVTLIITDYDERPLLLQQSNQVKTWYWVPDDSDTLLISDLFRDPDGAPVFLDQSDVSTDVWVCDTANGGDFTIDEVPDVPTRNAEPGSPLTFTGGDASADCSVSNLADPTATPAPDPNPGIRGSGGNRVVTTKVTGPILEIKANSLADDTDGDSIVSDRGSGTYAARVYLRAWSGPSDPPLSSTGIAQVNIMVKVGANNLPQFPGGATGFSVTLMEGDDQTEPMTSWVAGDLDVGGATNDSLTFGLSASGSKNVSVAGGSITLIENRGDNPATSVVETDFLLSLALKGSRLNYESGQSPFEIGLFVTDQWSDPVRTPIRVTLIDVNELVVRRPIDDQRLINGLSRDFDLTSHYDDPEDDEITYEAYSNQYTDVVEVDNATDTLTIHGKYAKEGENGESRFTVTLLASDSKGKEAVPLEFDVITRFASKKPSINALENGTLALGANIFEADSAGTVLMPLIEYTDDEPAPFAIFNGEPLFKAIVDPYLQDGEICTKGKSGCEQQSGKVAIVVGNNDLNYEATRYHKLSLALQDAWLPELVSDAVEFQVTVNDSNDAPTVVAGTRIADQMIVAHGSDVYLAGRHFTDEDGDRLIVNATSSRATVVDVSVDDLDQVVLKGLKEGESRITLNAVDPEGATSDNLTFSVKVGPNNAPIADEEAIAAQLPENNVLSLAEFVNIELDGLFADPDSGDMIVSTSVVSSDESVLLAIPTDEGTKSTLVGRRSGTASLTISATDQGGNVTSVENEIIVNAPPEEVTSLDAITLDRTTPVVVDVSDVFTDPDHTIEELEITAEASGDGEDRVTLGVTGTQLTITGIMRASPGEVEILLTATDPYGLTASSTFTATVINIGPSVVMEIEPQELTRIDPFELDLSGVFDDPDGEVSTITVTVADEDVVETSEVDDSMALTVTGLTVGSTSVTLTATDDNDSYTMLEFDVTVVNVAPVVANPISDQTTTRAENITLDISSTFDDPDDANDLLTITVSVQDSMIVDASLDGLTLTLAGLDVGVSNVTLTATGAHDGTVEYVFRMTIENVEPTAIGSIGPIMLEVGGEPTTQAIENLFSDDDPLAFTISIGDTSIASATMSGGSATITPQSRGATTVTVTALDPHGARATISGSVTVSDGQLKAVAVKSLASYGRAMIASVSSSVGARVMNDSRSSDVTLDQWAPVKELDLLTPTNDAHNEMAWNVMNNSNSASATSPSVMHGVDALRSTIGRGFALNLGAANDPSAWSVWGSVDVQSYEGDGYDGMASSVYLGADVSVAECWIIGFAVSGNSGESDYSWGNAIQTMDLSLTTLLPYVSYHPSERTSLWGVAGFGSGELDTTVVGAADDASNLSSQVTLIGGSQQLKSAARFNLALLADAAQASHETDQGSGAADDLSATVNRIRVGLESSFPTETGEDGMLEPFGQVNIRSDGGDGDTGTGIELVGGVRISGNAFSLEANGRTLATHGADKYSKSGFSLMARLNPSADATGISLSIAPRWGADALGNNILWHDTFNFNESQAYGTLAGFGNAGANRSMDAQIAYGLLIAHERYLLTSFVDLNVSDRDRKEILIGASLRQTVLRDANLEINFAFGRIEERSGTSIGKIGLNSTLSF